MSKEKVINKLIELSDNDGWGIDCWNHYVLSINDETHINGKSFRIEVTKKHIVFKRDDTVMFFTNDANAYETIKSIAEDCMVAKALSFVERL